MDFFVKDTYLTLELNGLLGKDTDLTTYTIVLNLTLVSNGLFEKDTVYITLELNQLFEKDTYLTKDTYLKWTF